MRVPSTPSTVSIDQAYHQILTAIEGLPENARMRRPFSASLQRMQLPPAGLVLGTWLARRLGVQPGDTVLRDRKSVV